jgi:glycosyltransferase involved in cell wall biosynthesis
MPIVSVIIPAYNQGSYLKECIDSVLDQTFQNLEAIIVDDGSTDNTRFVATQYSDSRVRYIYQSNKGLSGARNTGIKNANGSYITYLDSDDLFLPQKIELLLEKLESNRELGFVAGQAVLIDETGKKIGEVFDASPPKNPIEFLFGNPLHVGSILIKTEWQNRVGFFDENLRSYEDWDMWLRLAKAGCKMGWVAKPVSLYRFHSNQMTRDGTQMTEASFSVLNKHFRENDLPNDWIAQKSLAYSNAYLRAAPQAYLNRDSHQAKSHIDHAIRLDPKLLSNNAEPIAKRIAAWSDYSKTGDTLEFIKYIYDNLPDGIPELDSRREYDLSNKAVEVAFKAYQNKNAKKVIESIWFAARFRPLILINRGVISILIKSLLINLIKQDV